MGTILLWCICGLITMIIAADKGRDGCAWFFVGSLLGPLGIILALAFPPDRKHQPVAFFENTPAWWKARAVVYGKVAVSLLGVVAAVWMVYVYLMSGLWLTSIDTVMNRRRKPDALDGQLYLRPGAIYLYIVLALCLWLVLRRRRPEWARILQVDALLFVMLIVPTWAVFRIFR